MHPSCQTLSSTEHQPRSVAFRSRKFKVVVRLPSVSSEPNPMHRANASPQPTAHSGSSARAARLQLVSAGAGAPASGQSTMAADIPRPRAPPSVRLAGGVRSPVVKHWQSAAAPPAVSVCAGRCFRSVPSPSALAVQNVSRSVEAAGHPAAAPGTSVPIRSLPRPRSLLSRLPTTAAPHPVLPNHSIERTNYGLRPTFAAHVKR